MAILRHPPICPDCGKSPGPIQYGQDNFIGWDWENHRKSECKSIQRDNKINEILKNES